MAHISFAAALAAPSVVVVTPTGDGGAVARLPSQEKARDREETVATWEARLEAECLAVGVGSEEAKPLTEVRHIEAPIPHGSACPSDRSGEDAADAAITQWSSREKLRDRSETIATSEAEYLAVAEGIEEGQSPMDVRLPELLKPPRRACPSAGLEVDAVDDGSDDSGDHAGDASGASWQASWWALVERRRQATPADMPWMSLAHPNAAFMLLLLGGRNWDSDSEGDQVKQ